MVLDKRVLNFILIREKNKNFFLFISVYCVESLFYDWI